MVEDCEITSHVLFFVKMGESIQLATLYCVLFFFFQFTDTLQLTQFQVFDVHFFLSKSWNNDIVETCTRIFSVR